MQTVERRCNCNQVTCYLCQLDRVDGEARGVETPLEPPLSRSLEALKENSLLREKFAGKTVLIWSGEHRAYWGQEGGYTMRFHEAGRFDFEDAWRRSSHAGPEKEIEYEVVQSES